MGRIGPMQLLFRAHDDRRYISSVDRRVVKLGASQLREMNQFVAHLLEPAGDLLARFHPQLDDLPDIFLENAEDGVAGLEIDLSLREKIGASERKNENDEK